MPQIRVDNEVVDVPAFAPGAEILQNEVVKAKAEGGRTVFLVEPESRTMEIVDPQRNYHINEGTQIETTAPSVSG